MASRRRSRWLLLAAVAAALVIPPVAYWQLDHWRELRAARQAYAALSQCLFGSALAEVAEPERRLRSSVLAASLEERYAAWPGRCASYAMRLEQSARALRAQRLRSLATDGAETPCEPDARCRQWSTLLDELGRVRPFLRAAQLGAFAPRRLAGLAAELELDGGAADAVRAAPPPAELFDPRRMTPLYRGNYLRLLTDPGGSEVLRLLFYEDRSRYGLCSVDLRRSALARCRVLPPTIPVAYAGELLASEPGARTLLYAQGFVAERWTEGLYDAQSGAQLAAVPQRPAGGMVWRDGSFVRLEARPSDGEVQLHRQGPDGQVGSASAPLSDAVSAGPRLIWDEIVWTLHVGEGRHRLFAQRVMPGPDVFGEIVELGTTGRLKGKPEFDMCRTPEAFIVLVTGQRGDQSLRGTMVLRERGAWRDPVDLRIGSGRYGFTCQARRATLSWIGGVDEQLDAARAAIGPGEPAPERMPVRGRYQVNRLRCTARGCEHRRAAIELERHSRLSRYVAGDVGEAMVVLWRSPHGDVRMRLAPLEQLPTAPDVPLFDDLAHDGFGWDLERDPIFGRAGAVIVLVSAQVGTREESWTYGLRIDPAGKVEAVVVER